MATLSREEMFDQTVGNLRQLHHKLIAMQSKGEITAALENPAIIGDLLTEMRLQANLLFGYKIGYIDLINEAIKGTSQKRQDLYEKYLKDNPTKGTPSAAKSHSTELTRVDEANIEILKNKLTQIKYEYERYNGICMTLQTRMKEFDTERRMNP